MAERAEEAWGLYSDWIQGAASTHRQQTSSTRASWASKGISSGGAALENILGEFTTEYEGKIEEIQGGPTAQYLQSQQSSGVSRMRRDLDYMKADLPKYVNPSDRLTGRDAWESGTTYATQDEVNAAQASYDTLEKEFDRVSNMSMEEYYTYTYGSDAYEAGAFTDEPGTISLGDLVGSFGDDIIVGGEASETMRKFRAGLSTGSGMGYRYRRTNIGGPGGNVGPSGGTTGNASGPGSSSGGGSGPGGTAGDVGIGTA